MVVHTYRNCVVIFNPIAHGMFQAHSFVGGIKLTQQRLKLFEGLIINYMLGQYDAPPPSIINRVDLGF